ncbi:MAG: hypothetical protein DRP74_07740 [Candidatus Omnitrophota bacterium]|nr:MAG: hypothetical protein DRP74_07740 [Candidatus Omnitrophota bacterium]
MKVNILLILIFLFCLFYSDIYAWDPQYYSRQFLLGEEFYNEGKFRDAIRIFEDLLDKYPNDNFVRDFLERSWEALRTQEILEKKYEKREMIWNKEDIQKAKKWQREYEDAKREEERLKYKEGWRRKKQEEEQEKKREADRKRQKEAAKIEANLLAQQFNAFIELRKKQEEAFQGFQERSLSNLTPLSGYFVEGPRQYRDYSPFLRMGHPEVFATELINAIFPVLDVEFITHHFAILKKNKVLKDYYRFPQEDPGVFPLPLSNQASNYFLYLDVISKNYQKFLESYWEFPLPEEEIIGESIIGGDMSELSPKNASYSTAPED